MKINKTRQRKTKKKIAYLNSAEERLERFIKILEPYFDTLATRQLEHATELLRKANADIEQSESEIKRLRELAELADSYKTQRDELLARLPKLEYYMTTIGNKVIDIEKGFQVLLEKRKSDSNGGKNEQ